MAGPFVSSQAGDTASQRSFPYSLLVVEDDPLLLSLLEDILDFEFMKTVFVSSAAEAVSFLDTEGGCTILLTDYQLSGPMNGVMLSNEVIRRNPQTRVLITSGFDIATVNAAEGGNQFTVIQKPYSPIQLRETVLRLLPSCSDDSPIDKSDFKR